MSKEQRQPLRVVAAALRPMMAELPIGLHNLPWYALALHAARLRIKWSGDYNDYLKIISITAQQIGAELELDKRMKPWDLLCERILEACNAAIAAGGPVLDAALTHPDALAWCYQYWRAPDTDKARAKLRDGGKLTESHEIAAATQMWTESYMVQWMLQNSLGRSYHEAYPDSRLPEQWAYYIRNRPEEQSAAPCLLGDLTFMDPCCGAGLILREAFDMLAAMYQERMPHADRWSIAEWILSKHLHGVDIDPDVAAVARVVIYLRAWEFVGWKGQQGWLSFVPGMPLNYTIIGVPHNMRVVAQSMLAYLQNSGQAEASL